MITIFTLKNNNTYIYLLKILCIVISIYKELNIVKIHKI